MALILKNVSKSFDEKRIFSSLSYEFSDTGIYAICGESGKGKTTLLRLISGLDNDFEGEIVGGGIKNVSYAFQEPRLLPTLTTIDNVIFANHDKPDDAAVKKATNMLLRLGFSEEDTHLFPEELSGGMRQRVTLARAFLRDAPILLLDEPTKELDAENASIVKEIIKEESKRRLVILVTHNEADLSELDAVALKI
ncbi:MAG: ABC transporter ATP-binding protein [Clostridia bacterium]|nr:ABC transporter ATP-binding protein [Clostridia bacterium]